MYRAERTEQKAWVEYDNITPTEFGNIFNALKEAKEKYLNFDVASHCCINLCNDCEIGDPYEYWTGGFIIKVRTDFDPLQAGKIIEIIDDVLNQKGAEQ